MQQHNPSQTGKKKSVCSQLAYSAPSDVAIKHSYINK